MNLGCMEKAGWVIPLYAAAARLKAQYNLSYADASAAALTGGQHVLVTADVEHFERVSKLRLLKLPHAKRGS